MKPRLAERPTVRRTCPACSRRANQHVPADCPICSGHGFLILGRAALLRYPVEVVSRAVEYALEAQAGESLAARPFDLARARQELTEMVVKLAKAGLLHPGTLHEDSPVQSAMAHLQAQELSVRHGGLPYEPGTSALLSAPAVQYEPGSVPVTGMLPNFSKAGFLCSLARVADPLDVLEVHTPDNPSGDKMNRLGEVLGHAVAHK